MAEWSRKQQKEIDQARHVLADGEQILDVTTGMGKVRRMGQETHRNGGLLVTDRRVIFYSKKIGGYEMSDHTYGLLTSLDYKKGIVSGNINLNASGDHYHISMVPKDDVERVAQCIRSQMGAVTAHPASASASAAPDLADQLTRLAALRDQGILTEDEFAAQKAKLLS